MSMCTMPIVNIGHEVAPDLWPHTGHKPAGPEWYQAWCSAGARLGTHACMVYLAGVPYTGRCSYALGLNTWYVNPKEMQPPPSHQTWCTTMCVLVLLSQSPPVTRAVHIMVACSAMCCNSAAEPGRPQWQQLLLDAPTTTGRRRGR